jgi:hypothetical protein
MCKKTVLDLTAVDRPALTFSHRHNLEHNSADFGQRLFFVTGFSETTWSKVQIDLSECGHQTIVCRCGFA